MLHKKVLISVFTLLIHVFVWAQIPSSYQVGTWKDFKPSAVSYTFDG